MTIAETDRERERENLDESACCIPSGLLLQGEAVNALCKDGIIVSGMPAAKDNNLEKCDLEDRALAVGSFEFVEEKLQSCISKLNWLLERIARLPVACSPDASKHRPLLRVAEGGAPSLRAGPSPDMHHAGRRLAR